MNAPRNPRIDLIADTAIRLLVERGMRGLTHRAVDEGAGLPSGSTSYYARTRAALLEIALARMTELEGREMAGAFAAPGGGGAAAATPTAATPTAASPLEAPLPPGAGVEEAADLLAPILDDAIREGRDQKIARYELALEATRRPGLRAVYDAAGRGFREAATAITAALGSPEPARHGRLLVTWAEGVMFDSIAGAGWAEPVSREDLRTGLVELLRGMLSGGQNDGERAESQ